MKTFRILVLILMAPVFLAACAHFQEPDFGHYSKAEEYYSQGNYEKAIAEYANYLKQEPQGNMAIIAHYYTAKSQAAGGNITAAREGFQSIIEKYPDSDWAVFSRARIKELASLK